MTTLNAITAQERTVTAVIHRAERIYGPDFAHAIAQANTQAYKALADSIHHHAIERLTDATAEQRKTAVQDLYAELADDLYSYRSWCQRQRYEVGVDGRARVVTDHRPLWAIRSLWDAR